MANRRSTRSTRTRINGISDGTMSAGAAAAFAELATQVSTLEGDYADVKSSIVGLDRKFSDGISNLGTRFESSLAAVNAKLDERGKTPWATLASFAGVMVIVLGGFGTLIYRPIDLEQARIRIEVAELAKIAVARSELAIVTKYMDRDFTALQAQVKSNFDAIVPRGEHAEKWAGQTATIANLQRQIDDFRRDFGSTYSLRDAFVNVQRKVDDLEKELRDKAR